MCDCNGTPTVLEGPPGRSGTYILCAYNNLTGIGNDSPVDEDTLFTCELEANTLISSGDELELYAYIDYTDNDPVDFKVSLGGSNAYTFSIVDSDSSKRFFEIKIARISAISQLWTIKQLGVTAGTEVIYTLDTTSTTANLANALTFSITASNSALGANQVVLKKAVLYKNIIE